YPASVNEHYGAVLFRRRPFEFLQLKPLARQLRLAHVRSARLAIQVAIALTLALVATAQPADETVYDLGPGISPPRVVHQVTPKASATSDGFRVSGTVVVGLVV